MLYSLNGAYPTIKPARVRMPDGSTRTSDEVDAVLEELGYTQVSLRPDETNTHTYEWVDGQWQAVEKFWAIRIENNQVIEIVIYNGQDLIGNWVRFGATYFSNNQMPAPGYLYDSQAQIFLAPKPFNSWVLDAQGIWQSPISYPNDGKRYSWDEQNQVWTEIIG